MGTKDQPKEFLFSQIYLFKLFTEMAPKRNNGYSLLDLPYETLLRITDFLTPQELFMQCYCSNVKKNSVLDYLCKIKNCYNLAIEASSPLSPLQQDGILHHEPQVESYYTHYGYQEAYKPLKELFSKRQKSSLHHYPKTIKLVFYSEIKRESFIHYLKLVKLLTSSKVPEEIDVIIDDICPQHDALDSIRLGSSEASPYSFLSRISRSFTNLSISKKPKTPTDCSENLSSSNELVKKVSYKKIKKKKFFVYEEYFYNMSPLFESLVRSMETALENKQLTFYFDKVFDKTTSYSRFVLSQEDSEKCFHDNDFGYSVHIDQGEMSSAIMFPESVEALKLEGNDLRKTREFHMSQLKQLKSLNLLYHRTFDLSRVFLPLSLRELYMDRVMKLPLNEITKLSNLETLSAKYNFIEVFDILKFPPSLKHLNLKGNRLSSFDWAFFFHLVNLEKLVISDSQIDNLSNLLFMDQKRIIKNSKEINQVYHIFPGPRLKSLDVSFGNFTVLGTDNPRKLLCPILSQLEDLDISYSYVCEAKVSITSLKYLNLEDSMLDFGRFSLQLKKLKHLNMVNVGCFGSSKQPMIDFHKSLASSLEVFYTTFYQTENGHKKFEYPFREALPNVQCLYLKDTHVHEIGDTILLLPRIKYVILDNLGETLFPYLPKLEQVYPGNCFDIKNSGVNVFRVKHEV